MRGRAEKHSRATATYRPTHAACVCNGSRRLRGVWVNVAHATYHTIAVAMVTRVSQKRKAPILHTWLYAGSAYTRGLASHAGRSAVRLHLKRTHGDVSLVGAGDLPQGLQSVGAGARIHSDGIDATHKARIGPWCQHGGRAPPPMFIGQTNPSRRGGAALGAQTQPCENHKNVELLMFKLRLTTRPNADCSDQEISNSGL